MNKLKVEATDIKIKEVIPYTLDAVEATVWGSDGSFGLPLSRHKLPGKEDHVCNDGECCGGCNDSELSKIPEGSDQFNPDNDCGIVDY